MMSHASESEFHDGPLALRRSGVLGGVAGDGDAGGGVVQGGDELRPPLEGLLLLVALLEVVTGQRQRLLDQVLGQVQVLGNAVCDAQAGVLIREQLAEQGPVPLRELAVLVVTVVCLYLHLHLHIHLHFLLWLLPSPQNAPVHVQAPLQGLSRVRLINGREGIGRATV
ncbi:hypothetical protein AAFF_G00305440, partial [Aldrovandia affinis]